MKNPCSSCRRYRVCDLKTIVRRETKLDKWKNPVLRRVAQYVHRITGSLSLTHCDMRIPLNNHQWRPLEGGR